MPVRELNWLTVCSVFLVLWWAANQFSSYEISTAPAFVKRVNPSEALALPDFFQYPAGRERKKAFFAYLKPQVDKVNSLILQQRAYVLFVQQKVASGAELAPMTVDNLQFLFQRYGLPDLIDNKSLEALLVRVDVIPASLVLAQAANESAWGTSRFAKEGNNLFGQWCYVPGCGIVPSRRPEGDTHEVQRFESPLLSIEAYALNINRNDAYSGLRARRAVLRKAGQVISGVQLAEGLQEYSGRGIDYVLELQEMIRFNDLAEMDEEHAVKSL